MTTKQRLALLFLGVLGGALTWLGCGSDGEQKMATGSTTQKAFAQRIVGVNGLENFARVSPTLYRGAQPTEEGFKQLKAMGVKTVIDFRSYHSTKTQVEAAGMTALEIPLKADLGSRPPSEEELKTFFKAVLDPACQPVYIHCAFGKDRTGTMAAVYRLEIDGWSPEEAMQEMEAFGYHNIYRDLVNFIRTYKPRGFSKTP
ncbi:MAG TPA: tyrosine-protein phosphatase [Planctomycetota bacterium]|jgi:protein tyrosine/serine phosphatase|nr:tyrosine-protein phosphatase [Planctomycetota bacterium]